MIDRQEAMSRLETALDENPVAALLGPRQCGKTTLARMLADREGGHWFDMESAEDRAALAQPELALKKLTGLVVIDEIQRMPELFSTLRPLADRRDRPARFLILGSASPDLVKGVSETLAGRVGFVDLTGFHVGEVKADELDDLWLRGGFPRSFLAKGDAASWRWRTDFIRTFLERDLPQLGIRTPAPTLRRFWTMVGHFHGQQWNAAELARSLGSSEGTARNYLDILCGTYVVRRLQPWHTNLGKRELSAPKVYVRDSGLLHSLLGIQTTKDLHSHPKLGASWEGYGLEQVLALCGSTETYYWGTHNGAELDLLLFRGGKAYGVEFKVNDGPKMTKSLHIALDDLQLERAWIIHPGERSYPVHDKVEALPLKEVARLHEVMGTA
ncbi:ATP-binding protein [Prosthecobacter sp.]|jgi:predicted AAA+ superfamily ATPase|uniref:ATP-binding protein n=1 Tax=Prosthecobacter sp. TaxID=1965333 RepID=UPI003783AD16